MADEDKSTGFIGEKVKSGVDAINQMQEGNASKLSTNFNKDRHVLKYPLDVGAKNGHYMIFNIYARTDSESDLPADDSNVSGNLGTYDAKFTSERLPDTFESSAGRSDTESVLA